MVQMRLYHDTPVDTSSDWFREKVSESIKHYIKENWDDCIILEDELDDKYWQCYIKVKL